MEFLISKASGADKPCDEAYPTEIFWLEASEYHPAVYKTGWVIDLYSLKQLVTLSEKLKQPIIVEHKSYHADERPSLQVYDDYIE